MTIVNIASNELQSVIIDDFTHTLSGLLPHLFLTVSLLVWTCSGTPWTTASMAVIHSCISRCVPTVGVGSKRALLSLSTHPFRMIYFDNSIPMWVGGGGGGVRDGVSREYSFPPPQPLVTSLKSNADPPTCHKLFQFIK